MVELTRACPNPRCRGRVPVDQPNCPECGANFVAARIESHDPETRKHRSARGGGKRVDPAASARKALAAGATSLALAVVLFVLRGEGESVNYVVTLLIVGVAGIVGGVRLRALAKRQAEREAKRRR